MSVKYILTLLSLSCLLASTGAMYNSKDPSTYANIDQVVTDHIKLDFTVDFDAKVFDGHVILSMRTVDSGVRSVFLDSVGMEIARVEYQSRHRGRGVWSTVDYNITTPNPNLGNALEVHLPRSLEVGSEFYLRLYYTTNENSTAISWLTPAQTAGKKLPYLFTQCQDIACRSVAPMQDTPAIKVTYEARVVVPGDFVVKMSANETNLEWLNTTHKAYSFESTIKMPSYLIAIAVGDLEYRSLGKRVGVITEPVKMDAVAWELESLQTLLDDAEEYLTPYIWGNYSILVLPPSFPFGGMENPLLTFASPTIITGDRSQVDVATHEIAHSWTGNDVTCENWSHLWLNEGFTVFEERKVSAKLHGEDFSKVNAFLGNISAYSAMEGYGLDDSYSSLYPVINGGAPDEAFSTIPYEKGFQLLHYLESLIGADHM